MSTSAHKLDEIKDALQSCALRTRNPIKDFVVHVNESGGCVTVQWIGRLPRKEPEGWWEKRRAAKASARKGKGRGKNKPNEKRCEAKFFFREEDTPPDTWPDGETGSVLEWPKDPTMRYVGIFRSLEGKAPSMWQPLTLSKSANAKNRFAAQYAEYFVRSIAGGGPSKPAAGGGALPAVVVTGCVALIGVAIWAGVTGKFGGADPEDSYAVFDENWEDQDSYSYDGGSSNGGSYPRAQSGSTTPEQGYEAGTSGGEEGNRVASEGFERVGGVGADGSGLAGAAAGPAGTRVAFADLPYCWTDASGAAEPVFSATREAGGIRLEPAYPSHRAAAYGALPREGLVLSHPISSAQFEKLYEPLFLYSLNHGCRLAVQETAPASADLDFGSFREAVSGYFYLIPQKS